MSRVSLLNLSQINHSPAVNPEATPELSLALQALGAGPCLPW